MLWSEESCDESRIENTPEPDLIREVALDQDVRSYLRVAEISGWVAVVLGKVFMPDSREEPWIQNTSFPLRLSLGGGLRTVKLVQEILIDQLSKINLSVLDNRVGHLNVSGGGLIKTSYLAREALDEMSEEIAEFRAHLPSLHSRH